MLRVKESLWILEELEDVIENGFIFHKRYQERGGFRRENRAFVRVFFLWAAKPTEKNATDLRLMLKRHATLLT